MKMTTKKRVTVLFVLAVLTVWTLWGNTALQITEYTVSSGKIPQAFDGFRIVQVSDLHNADYWEENGDLIRKLKQAEPDIIVITGDMIDSSKTDIDLALSYAEQMIKIAPTYFVTGNHEAWVSSYERLKTGLIELGIVVLDDKKVTLERDGAYIDLIGIDDPSFSYKNLEPAAPIMQLMGDEDAYTVLLAHRPELFNAYVGCGVDLVFSGHAHGGQFRLPIIGGLIAPDQGLFPRYDAGMYFSKDTTMIVSRGIGNSVIPIRFNNRPEIPVVILKAA